MANVVDETERETVEEYTKVFGCVATSRKLMRYGTTDKLYLMSARNRGYAVVAMEKELDAHYGKVRR